MATKPSDNEIPENGEEKSQIWRRLGRKVPG